MPRILRNLRITEVSGVDKGAGRGVKIMLMKRDGELDKREFSSEERDRAADSGAALPDGSFPIKNKSDLRNAIQAIGRAKNRARAMAHIKARARALGATDMLPDEWNKRDDDRVGQVEDGLDALTRSLESALEEDADLAKSLDDSLAAFRKHVLGESEETEMTPEQIQKSIDDAIAAERKRSDEAIAKAQDEIALLKMTAAQREYFDKLTDDEAKKRFKAMSDDERNECMNGKSKRDPQAEELAKRDNRIAELEKQLGRLVDGNQAVEFSKRAEAIGLKAEDGAIIRKAFGGDADAQSALLKRFGDEIAALKSQVKTSKLFGEFGSAGPAGDKSAYEELEALAASLKKAEPKLTKEQAFAKVYTDPANAELVRRQKFEQEGRLAKIAARS